MRNQTKSSIKSNLFFFLTGLFGTILPSLKMNGIKQNLQNNFIAFHITMAHSRPLLASPKIDSLFHDITRLDVNLFPITYFSLVLKNRPCTNNISTTMLQVVNGIKHPKKIFLRDKKVQYLNLPSPEHIGNMKISPGLTGTKSFFQLQIKILNSTILGWLDS